MVCRVGCPSSEQQALAAGLAWFSPDCYWYLGSEKSPSVCLSVCISICLSAFLKKKVRINLNHFEKEILKMKCSSTMSKVNMEACFTLDMMEKLELIFLDITVAHEVKMKILDTNRPCLSVPCKLNLS